MGNTSKTAGFDDAPVARGTNQIVTIRKERGRLFSALESLVNMGEGLQELERFRLLYPWFDFWDVTVVFADGREAGVAIPELHPYILQARGILRRWWKNRQLGRSPNLRRFRESFLLGQVHWGHAYELMAGEILPKFPGAGFVRWNESIDEPDYAKRMKRIVPRTSLGKAVLLIFAEKWRARTCGVCGKLFVADKANQRYCGWECSKSAEAKRKEMWRRNHAITQ